MTAIVLVRKFEIRKASNQKSFGSLKLNLGRAGNFEEVDGKIWDLDVHLGRGAGEPRASDLLEIEHQADEYQGRKQWIIRSYRMLSADEREKVLASFTPENRIDRAFYQQRLDDLIDETDSGRISGLILREIFDRAGFREAFYHAPAARDHHQNYPGGLLEHTLNVTTLALALADAYAAPSRSNAPGLTFNSDPLPIDRQIIIAAGLLHDIGKLETYRFEPMSEITDAQRWEGHLAIGYAVVRALGAPLADAMDAAARDEFSKLLHCILSHHGQLEFGSPVLPACAEAFLLSQADLTDARLAEIASTGREILARDPAARWARGPLQFKSGVFVGDWHELSKPKEPHEA